MSEDNEDMIDKALKKMLPTEEEELDTESKVKKILEG